MEPELPRQLCQPSLRYWLMMGASWCCASSTALLKAFSLSLPLPKKLWVKLTQPILRLVRAL